MKKYLSLAILLLLASYTVHAGNSYLQKFDHYQVTSMGGNVLRFTIPIWVYGEGDDNTYYLRSFTENDNNKNNSYLWYSETSGPNRGDASVHRIVSFGAQRKPNYDGRKAGGVGYAYVLVGDGAGTIVVRNTYSGEPLTLMPNDDSHWVVDNSDASSVDQRIEVTRTNTSYGKYTVYLQMDWYIPESLQDKQFYVGLNVRDYYVKDNDGHNDYWWQWEKPFSGENPQSPELFDPYFYALSLNGEKPKGKAGVQYVAYQDVTKYYTSFAPFQKTIAEGRSGTILVDMHDTIRTVNATFTVVPDKSVPDVTQDLISNSVNIPAYHKIHNFGATEVKDAQENVTGDVQLTWNTMYPTAEDIISSDIFEIQRATKSDFSDAQSIGMDMLSATESNYTFIDESENVRRVLSVDTSDAGKITDVRDVPLYIDGDNVGTINAKLESNMYSPGKTLYYRIRRGSAAVWDWEESDWMRTASVIKHDFLSPLKGEQPSYTLDTAFEENRLVHFNFNLDNVAITQWLDPIEQLPFDYTVKEVNSQFPVEAHYTIKWKEGNPLPNTYSYIFYQEWMNKRDTLDLTIESQGSNYITYKTYVRNGANVVFYLTSHSGSATSKQEFGPLNDVSIELRESSSLFFFNSWGVYRYTKTPIDLKSQLASYVNTDSIKQVLYHNLETKLSDESYGRCSWDNNARLILSRTFVETGETVDFIIPNDSIIRQPQYILPMRLPAVASIINTPSGWISQPQRSRFRTPPL